jgi:hypothetical protein
MGNERLSKRQKGLLTLICDKMNMRGYSMGAHYNSNWCTQQYYENVPGQERLQGTLDRIGKIEYSRCFHIHRDQFEEDPKGLFGWLRHKRLGPELYDHSIHCVWREPFGKGWGPNPPESMMEKEMTDVNGKPYIMPSCLTKDKAGNWHMPCDLAFWVTLWHPHSQNGDKCGEGQEAIVGCWRIHPAPHWRPTYHYTDVEVIEALQVMCRTFDWEFERKSDSEYMIMH